MIYVDHRSRKGATNPPMRNEWQKQKSQFSVIRLRSRVTLVMVIQNGIKNIAAIRLATIIRVQTIIRYPKQVPSKCGVSPTTRHHITQAALQMHRPYYHKRPCRRVRCVTHCDMKRQSSRSFRDFGRREARTSTMPSPAGGNRQRIPIGEPPIRTVGQRWLRSPISGFLTTVRTARRVRPAVGRRPPDYHRQCNTRVRRDPRSLPECGVREVTTLFCVSLCRGV